MTYGCTIFQVLLLFSKFCSEANEGTLTDIDGLFLSLFDNFFRFFGGGESCFGLPLDGGAGGWTRSEAARGLTPAEDVLLAFLTGSPDSVFSLLEFPQPGRQN